jgi:hypothetical protein
MSLRSTSHLPGELNDWQIQQLYRQRADTENVFDELKNQCACGVGRHTETSLTTF